MGTGERIEKIAECVTVISKPHPDEALWRLWNQTEKKFICKMFRMQEAKETSSGLSPAQLTSSALAHNWTTIVLCNGLYDKLITKPRPCEPTLTLNAFVSSTTRWTI